MIKMRDKIGDFNWKYRGLIKFILVLGWLFQSQPLGSVDLLSFFILLRDLFHHHLLLCTKFFQKKIDVLLSIVKIVFHLHL